MVCSKRGSDPDPLASFSIAFVAAPALPSRDQHSDNDIQRHANCRMHKQIVTSAIKKIPFIHYLQYTHVIFLYNCPKSNISYLMSSNLTRFIRWKGDILPVYAAILSCSRRELLPCCIRVDSTPFYRWLLFESDVSEIHL